MQSRLPFQVIYETPESVPVSDIIESLRGTMMLAQEIKPLLELLIPGLSISEVTVTVTSIEQASPLRELFFVGLLGAYQDKLSTDMPNIVHDLFGISPPPELDNLISLLLITLVFYSGSFVFNATEKMIEKSKTQRQLDGLIADVAKMLHQDEHHVREIISKKYHRSGISNVFSAAQKFLTPSKNQNNASLRVGNRDFPRYVVAEFPNQAQIKMDEPGPTSYPLENVEIYLHAQDLDRNKKGWAAVLPSLSSKRIPMSLMPPLTPPDLYTRESVRGDVLIEARKNIDGEITPVRVHLIRLREDATGPSLGFPAAPGLPPP